MKLTRNVGTVSNVTMSKTAAAIASTTRFLLMAMCMVRVRHMWMRVPQRLVTVPMAVRTGRHRDMHMVVVPVVVAVRVFMFRRLMSMLVSVRLREMKDHPCKHQHAA